MAIMLPQLSWAQDSSFLEHKNQKKLGAFSIGGGIRVVSTSFENFNTLGNTPYLNKRYLTSTASTDKDGNRVQGARNLGIDISALYRVVDRHNSFWGIEASFSRGITAYAYKNLEQFNYPTQGSPTVISWINWHTTNRFSLSFQKTLGIKEHIKWYFKFNTSLINLASLNDRKDGYTQEWINNNNTGGIWESKILNRNIFAVAPEFGRVLFTSSKRNKQWVYYVGASYQIGLSNLYELKYYTVNNGNKSQPNSIVSRGNRLDFNFKLFMPVTTTPIGEREKNKVKPKEEKVEVNNYSQNNLVFLLDVSFSMAQGGKLQLLKQYMANMLDSLPPYDYITLITFSGNAKLVLKPTQVIDKEDILSQLEELEPKGGTDANRGIRKAYDVLRKNYIDKGNNRIIVATDGSFKVNAKSKRLIEENFTDKKIKLSVFHFAGDRRTSAASLKELAAIGGGNYALVNEDNIDDKLQEEYQQKAD